MQFKKDRYDCWDSVEGEWLNGKPHGVCIVENLLNRGIATFTNGLLHGGPHWIAEKFEGPRYSCEYIDNGIEKGVFRKYRRDLGSSEVSGKNIPTPGWMEKIISDVSQEIRF